ncbi:hypothetical protein ACFQ9X_56070 [Catenulispora yoronensis]
MAGRLDLSPFLTLPGPPVFIGWRAAELRFRERHYEDFRTWAPSPLPSRWFEP